MRRAWQFPLWAVSIFIGSAGFIGCNNNNGTADGPTPDMAVAPDMARPPLGQAIQTPKGTWTWVDFPDAVCDDNTPTGVGIRQTDSPNLLVFLNGGGACWDYTTCVQLNTSTHGPFGKAQFDGLNILQAQGTILGPQADNSFKDWNMVYVPYCTGDVHAGDNVNTYKSGGLPEKTLYHKGHANIIAYLKRLGATFPHPGKLAWTGSSAGGFGAAINYYFARQYWPDAKSYLIDDSGPPLVGDDVKMFLRDDYYNAWNIGSSIGALCPDCRDDLSAFIPIIVAKFPHDRLALLSSKQDQTISGFYIVSGPIFEMDLDRFAMQRLDPTANFRYFFQTGKTHTMLGDLASHTTNGVNVNAWLTAMASDDASWMSVKP